jgi:hypothetical protein
VETNEQDERPPGLRASVWVFVSLAAVAGAITLLFLGMRSVMKIGGTCASGGPYQISSPCPKGVPLVMLAGIWGGLIFAALYAYQAIKAGIPSFLWLLWPALFLSLGWNFLQFAVDPPGGTGPVVGWIICAVLFFLMGGIPLIPGLAGLSRAVLGKPPPAPAGLRGMLTPGALKATASGVSAMRKLRRSRAWQSLVTDASPAS